MIKVDIENETGKLSAVIVGIADGLGGTPKLDECYDPKSKAHILAGTYPLEKNCIDEISALVSVLINYGVEVFRPRIITGLNQIFSRDIAFVIADKFVLPNIIRNRKEEVLAIDDLVSQIPSKFILRMPAESSVEGGDVLPWNEYVFVGYSEKEDFEKYTVARTNRAGLNFLVAAFPSKKIKGLELNKSDINPRENTLHLDCCFQPIGKNMAILYKDGLKNQKDVDFLINYFGPENIIEISQEEMYNMNANIFSISEQVIISEKGFTRLNTELRKRGFIVEEVPYAEIAKMEGLLRCSTIPLIRER